MRRVDRRTFLKRLGVVSAATAAAGAVPGMVFPTGAILPRGDQSGPVWKKTPCRLCGVGCGLLVGIENGRAVAVKGDPDSPVSKGLACVKGYHSVQALYGPDRITRAMVRRDGVLVEVPAQGSARPGGAQAARDRRAARQGQRRHLRLGPVDHPGRLRRVEAVQGSAGNQQRRDQRAPLRRPARWPASRAASASMAAIGCYEDIDHADVFVLWDANLAETDPVLFSRMLDRRRVQPRRPHHRAVATRTTRTSYAVDHSLLHAAAYGAGDRQRHLPRDRGPEAGCSRSSWTSTSPSNGARRHRLRSHRRHPGRGRRHRQHLETSTWRFSRTTSRSAPRSCPGCSAARHSLAGVALWRPAAQGDVGLGPRGEPGRARHLDEQPALQHPSAGGESRLAREQPLLPPRASRAAGARCTTRAA